MTDCIENMPTLLHNLHRTGRRVMLAYEHRANYNRRAVIRCKDDAGLRDWRTRYWGLFGGAASIVDVTDAMFELAECEPLELPVHPSTRVAGVPEPRPLYASVTPDGSVGLTFVERDRYRIQDDWRDDVAKALLNVARLNLTPEPQS
jgi:hypothetical protein